MGNGGLGTLSTSLFFLSLNFEQLRRLAALVWAGKLCSIQAIVRFDWKPAEASMPSCLPALLASDVLPQLLGNVLLTRLFVV